MTTTASYLGKEPLDEGIENRVKKIVGQEKEARDREMGLIEEGLRIFQRVYEIGEEKGARFLEPG